MKKLVVVSCVFIALFFFTVAYAKNTHSDIADSVIRLHIVANSNSDFDQNVKLKIRDGILSSFSFNADNIDDLKEEIEEKLPQIELFANNLLEKENAGYCADAKLCINNFPTKEYGNIKLPCGKYTALKILLGDAVGENWWCVMFPPLCFTDNATGYIDASSDEILKNNLTDEQYRLITSEDTEIQIKFKLVELVNKIKNMRCSK